ncbi:esterase/lipase family protein [Hymenobacter yonginensis]|uniref:Alpha/beta hydrolase n=1 Tax=Hymenobacter yonginensis TaxID=748197 RepID=A0ABY7PHW5_9BACT|nr:alpha/beta hydrolase [Hymenobacter yonginensis]WBO82998.1 alpha/beta hydrolase [Hymenobacter yonginensis]
MTEQPSLPEPSAPSSSTPGALPPPDAVPAAAGPPAPTDDPPAGQELPDAAPSRWKRAIRAVGRAATVPFNTAGFLYRTGQENIHFTLPVLNGAFGDQLAERQDRRAIRMSFRRHAADVPVSALRLTPGTKGPRKVVVFLHGLMGDEVIWQAGSGEGGLRYGPRLQQEAGVVCLYVRYNTGLHISQNGQLLHALLTELLEAYPDAIGRLSLVGHSMGGLVIRSAGYYAAQAAVAVTGISWLTHLQDVFLLGVPNDGSFLEQNSHFTSVVLRKINLRPTRFISGLIDKRSNGIKDLRHAILVDDDWQDPHADDLFPPRTLVPPLPGVRYHVLVGSLLKSANSALHDYFGDGLVGAGSALGRVFGDPALPPEQQISTRVFPKLHHGTLLSNPEVYQYLRDRLQ